MTSREERRLLELGFSMTGVPSRDISRRSIYFYWSVLLRCILNTMMSLHLPTWDFDMVSYGSPWDRPDWSDEQSPQYIDVDVSE